MKKFNREASTICIKALIIIAKILIACNSVLDLSTIKAEI